MSVWAQRSFTGGEISPSLYSRCDQTKYQTGLRTCRNFLIPRQGGVSNRPGTQFIGEVKDSTKQVRLIPFIFNIDQTYILEFGDLYMRVIRNGAYIVKPAKTITNVSRGTITTVTSAAHGYSNGQEVQISGLLGITQLNGRNFKVADVTTNTFNLKNMDGTYLNSSSYNDYISGGSAFLVYEIATPYVVADLPLLKFVQSADVITLVHGNYPPAQLARTAHDNWTLTNIVFGSTIAAPTISGFATLTPGTEPTKNITNISTVNPGVISVTAHGYKPGDLIHIAGVVGTVQLNGQNFRVRNPTSGTFEISSSDETDVRSYDLSTLTAYISGGTTARTYDPIAADYWAVTQVDLTTGDESLPSFISDFSHPTVSVEHPVEIAMAIANTYNLYRRFNGIFGFIGTFNTGITDIIDNGTIPDVTTQPPVDPAYFTSPGNYPSVVNFYQQRLALANTSNEPETVFLSQTGLFHNFYSHRPLVDSDPIKFSMAGKQVNSIKNLIDLGALILFTQTGEWSAAGNQSGAITPSQINLRQHSYCGSADLVPIVIAASAIFVQGRGSIIRDLAWDFLVDGYRGNELTIFASHLFDNFTLVDWAYQQIPNSIVWAVRSDGALLGMTYIKEQQILGWHHHDFDGTVENVCSIPEGNEDAVYLVLNRTVNGETKRYIERFYTRKVLDIRDSVFVDAALSYDGRNTGSTTMTLSGSGWTYQDTLTLTSSTSFFLSSDVGNQIQLNGSDGTQIRATITGYSSATTVNVTPNKTVPVSMQAVAIKNWAKAVSTVTNLWHIEGKSVSVFADGLVAANPNNDDYDVLTVSQGTIVLDKPYAVIHVGLPITSDIETLDIDTANGESIANKKKIITRLTSHVEDSRGFWAGPTPPSDNGLDGLVEFKVRNEEGYDDPIALLTDKVDLVIGAQWNSNGRVFIRQTDPLPLSIQSIIPDGLIPFKGSGG